MSIVFPFGFFGYVLGNQGGLDLAWEEEGRISIGEDSRKTGVCVLSCV